MSINGNNYKVLPVDITDRTKRFHRDEKPKKLVKEFKNDKNVHLHNNRSFAEILNEEMAKKK